MSLQDHVRETFAPGGLLSRMVEEFQPRLGQTEMASAVARTIETGGVLVVEAGTGIGKTLPTANTIATVRTTTTATTAVCRGPRPMPRCSRTDHDAPGP